MIELQLHLVWHALLVVAGYDWLCHQGLLSMWAGTAHSIGCQYESYQLSHLVSPFSLFHFVEQGSIRPLGLLDSCRLLKHTDPIVCIKGIKGIVYVCTYVCFYIWQWMLL